MSTDEMTGIQALERIAPTIPMQPGQVERREFEYERHGTLSLIANFDVVSGQVVSPSLGPTRTEADFAAHIARTIDLDPAGIWLFVVDQLNTHQSEALVRLVAERCALDDELGEKGKSGVLRSMATRAAFLSDRRTGSSFCTYRNIPHGSIRLSCGSVSWCGGCSNGATSRQWTLCMRAFWSSLSISTRRPSPSSGRTLVGRSSSKLGTVFRYAVLDSGTAICNLAFRDL
jgi:hypothetical protein